MSRILTSTIASKALLCSISLLVLSVACNPQPPAPQPPSYDEQGKLLLISEAQQAFGELYKSGFSADKTQLLVGAD